jgi:hypothetical protein
MQIFEITNKKLDEVNWGAFAKGVGSQLARNVKSDLGIQSADNKVSGVAAQNSATAATANVVKQQSQAQQQLWSKTLQTMTAAASQAGTAQIDPQALATNFNKQLQGMIKPHGLTASIKPMNGVPVPQVDDFTDQIDPEMLDAHTKAQVAQTVQQINQSIASILAAPPNAKAADLANNWMGLAQGVADAASMTTFHANPAARTSAGNNRSIAPADQAVVDALGVDDAGMQNFARMAQASGKPIKPTGNPTVDGFLRAAGVRFSA